MLLIPVNNCRGSELEKTGCAIYQKDKIFARKYHSPGKIFARLNLCHQGNNMILSVNKYIPDEFVNILLYIPIDKIWERNAHQKTFV